MLLLFALDHAGNLAFRQRRRLGDKPPYQRSTAAAWGQAALPTERHYDTKSPPQTASANFRQTSRFLAGQPLNWRPIHAIRKSTMRDWRSGGIAVSFGTFHHFDRQSRRNRPLRGFATRGEANTPSASESRATGAGVLRLEHGMSAHRGLFAVVWRIRSALAEPFRFAQSARRCGFPKGRRPRKGRLRSETCSDEVLAMATDRLHVFVRDVLPVRFRKPEPAAELGLRKPLERCISRCHHFTTINSSQRVEERFESFVRFIFHDFSPMPSDAENTFPLPKRALSASIVL